MSDLFDMHVEDCPRCGRPAISQYGGERGEAGPFLYCNACGYDEEHKVVPIRPQPVDPPKSAYLLMSAAREQFMLAWYFWIAEHPAEHRIGAEQNATAAMLGELAKFE